MHPFFHILGRTIPSYGLMIALGLVAATALAWRRARRQGLSTDHLLTIVACGIGLAMVGAKLLYLFTAFSPAQLLEYLRAGNFQILSDGGMVFYGGLFGGIAGAWLGVSIAGTRLSLYVDALVPAIPFGHAFGRVGCFLAGCCYGIPWQGALAVCYPPSPLGLTPEGPVFPTQLLESLLCLVLCGLLLWFGRYPHKPLDLAGLYLILYGLMRFGLEYLRGDLIRGFFGPLSTSQWISLLMLLAGILCFVLGRCALFPNCDKK